MFRKVRKERESLEMQFAASRIMGFNFRDPNRATPCERPYLVLLGLGSSIFMLANLLATSINNYDNVEIFSEGLSISSQCLTNITKMYILLARSKLFMRLIQESRRLQDRASPDEDALFVKAKRQELTIMSIYQMITVSTGILAILMPTTGTIKNSIASGEWIVSNPFNVQLPYDPRRIEFFVLTYVVLFIFVTAIVTVILSVDGLFCWYILNIGAHFDVIGMRAKKIACTLKETQNFQQFRRAVGEMVDYHCDVLVMTRHLNRLYGEMIFMEITLSSIQLCVALFKFTVKLEPVDFMFTIAMMCRVSGELLMFCFGGEHLIGKSEQIYKDLIGLMPWADMPPTMSTLLLLPMQRTQKEILLQGYFYTLRCSLLVWVFKTTGSFATLILALDK